MVASACNSGIEEAEAGGLLSLEAACYIMSSKSAGLSYMQYEGLNYKINQKGIEFSNLQVIVFLSNFFFLFF